MALILSKEDSTFWLDSTLRISSFGKMLTKSGTANAYGCRATFKGGTAFAVSRSIDTFIRHKGRSRKEKKTENI